MRKSFFVLGALASLITSSLAPAFAADDEVLSKYSQVVRAEESLEPASSEDCNFSVFNGGDEVPLDVQDKINEAKPILIKIRCGVARTFTNPYFEEFEKDGLKPGEIRDKIDGLVTTIEATPSFLLPKAVKDVLPQLKQVRNEMDKASKDDDLKDKRLGCKTDCESKTVSCTVDGQPI